MDISLKKWNRELKFYLMHLYNHVERAYLSNRLPEPYTEKDADWLLSMVSEHDGKDGVYRAIVVDNKVVGNISIELKTDVYCKDSDIGYLLLPDYYSKGIMTEAIRLIFKEAFNELDIIRITGRVYDANIASQRVLEKNGFIKEGVLKQAVFKNKNIYDLYVYGKLK